MELGLVGDQISRVSFDHAVTFLTEAGAELRIGTALQLFLPDGVVVDVDPEDAAAQAHLLVALLHRTVTRSEVDDAGRLVVGFDELSLGVLHSEDYEAWDYNGRAGEKVICMPGGELAVWGRTG